MSDERVRIPRRRPKPPPPPPDHVCRADASTIGCPRCDHNRALRTAPDICRCGHARLEHYDGYMFCSWTHTGECDCNQYKRAQLDLRQDPEPRSQPEPETALVDPEAPILERRPPNKDQWVYRIKLSAQQAMIGFPRDGTIEIAFENETVLDRSVPYNLFAPDLIYDHIQVNKGDDGIWDDTCIQAIQFIVEAAHQDIGQVREPT